MKVRGFGQHPASAIRRAYLLLHGDGGRTDDAIAEFLFCSEDTALTSDGRWLA